MISNPSLRIISVALSPVGQRQAASCIGLSGHLNNQADILTKQSCTEYILRHTYL